MRNHHFSMKNHHFSLKNHEKSSFFNEKEKLDEILISFPDEQADIRRAAVRIAVPTARKS